MIYKLAERCWKNPMIRTIYIWNKKLKASKSMNKKQVIRLNESQLKRIVKESVKRALNENQYKDYSQYFDMFDQAYETIRKVYKDLSKHISYQEACELCNSNEELPYLVGHAMMSLRDCYNNLGSVTIEIQEPINQASEPEDWYERNEHGDFDEY